MGREFCGVRIVPGVSKELRCGVMSWMRISAFSVMVAVRVVGVFEESVGGHWWARIRLVVEWRGMDLDSRIGSVESSSSEAESESESCPRSIRLRPLSFITMSSFSFAFRLSAWVPATAYRVAGYVLRLGPRESGTISNERHGHVVLSVCSIS